MDLRRHWQRIGRYEVYIMSEIEIISITILSWLITKFVLDIVGINNIIAIYVAWKVFEFLAKAVVLSA